jgi:hypothetical protein
MKTENWKLENRLLHTKAYSNPFTIFNSSRRANQGSALMLMMWAILLMSVTVLGVVEYIRTGSV